MISFKRGYKYQLAAPWRWKLVGDFEIVSDYRNRYYWISKERREIGAYTGCAWDGATWFPDFNWIIEGSLGHDLLHWMIAKGIIPENQNDLIDRELQEIIQARAPLPKLLPKSVAVRLLKARAWYVRKGTNLVDQKLGDEKPVITIGRT